jgi:hypothetical protein
MRRGLGPPRQGGVKRICAVPTGNFQLHGVEGEVRGNATLTAWAKKPDRWCRRPTWNVGSASDRLPTCSRSTNTRAYPNPRGGTSSPRSRQEHRWRERRVCRCGARSGLAGGFPSGPAQSLPLLKVSCGRRASPELSLVRIATLRGRGDALEALRRRAVR